MKAEATALWLRDPVADWITGSIGEVLRRRAEEGGDHPALHWMDAAGTITTLSYRELYAASRERASALLSLAAPGDAVAVFAPNSREWLLVELGSALAGTVLVPINPAMPDDEVEHILDLTQARVVLTVESYRGQRLEERMRALAATRSDPLVVLNLSSWAQEVRGGADISPVKSDHPFIIQYTSGTTGRPKGALHTHESALNAGAIWCRDWGHGAGDVLATAAPLFHVGGSITIVLGTIAVGASVALMASYEPSLLLRLLAETEATVLAAVPTVLFDLLEQPEFSREQLPRLHTVMGGGADVSPETIRSIEEGFGVRCVVTYGQSEAPAVLQTRRDDPLEMKATRLGRPLPGRDVRIARSDGSTADDDEVGQICTRSAMRMVEYFGQPMETAQVVDSEGWLYTGDLGAMDATGYVSSHGRARDVIIRGGENIYPEEVERVFRQHDSVVDVAVVAAPDSRWGEVPAGFVQPAPGCQVDTADLVSFGRARLASFKVPRQWVVVEEFPRTATGKIRKADLRGRLSDSSATKEAHGSKL